MGKNPKDIAAESSATALHKFGARKNAKGKSLNQRKTESGRQGHGKGVSGASGQLAGPCVQGKGGSGGSGQLAGPCVQGKGESGRS